MRQPLAQGALEIMSLPTSNFTDKYIFTMLNLLESLSFFRSVTVSQLGPREVRLISFHCTSIDSVQSAGTQEHICVGAFCFSSFMSYKSSSGLPTLTDSFKRVVQSDTLN